MLLIVVCAIALAAQQSKSGGKPRPAAKTSTSSPGLASDAEVVQAAQRALDNVVFSNFSDVSMGVAAQALERLDAVVATSPRDLSRVTGKDVPKLQTALRSLAGMASSKMGH